MRWGRNGLVIIDLDENPSPAIMSCVTLGQPLCLTKPVSSSANWI